ncbi:type II TA system antitoxin MqsA family protein [Cupriavidus sp. 2TAF22]|uniref:type II TA system antitoxin MqsA family protein n=1 Tax=unclassified Cupriavidus TaxID=2640874 RepID=UPI003F9209B9
MKQHECPACGEHALRELRQHASFEFEGKALAYCSLATECQTCGLEFVDDEQSKTNKRAVVAARSAALRIPSTLALRNWRKKWGLNQRQAGELLGVGPTAFSKYENDDLVPSAPTARLLYLVTQSDIAVQKLAARYEIDLPVEGLEASASVSHQPVAAEEKTSDRIRHLAQPTAQNRGESSQRSVWSAQFRKQRVSVTRRKLYEITPEGISL